MTIQKGSVPYPEIGKCTTLVEVRLLNLSLTSGHVKIEVKCPSPANQTHPVLEQVFP